MNTPLIFIVPNIRRMSSLGLRSYQKGWMQVCGLYCLL